MHNLHLLKVLRAVLLRSPLLVRELLGFLPNNHQEGPGVERSCRCGLMLDRDVNAPYNLLPQASGKVTAADSHETGGSGN